MSEEFKRLALRKKNLQLLNQAAGSINQLSQAVMLRPERIQSVFANAQPVDNVLAMHIEEMLALDSGWFDRPQEPEELPDHAKRIIAGEETAEELRESSISPSVADQVGRPESGRFAHQMAMPAPVGQERALEVQEQQGAKGTQTAFDRMMSRAAIGSFGFDSETSDVSGGNGQGSEAMATPELGEATGDTVAVAARKFQAPPVARQAAPKNPLPAAAASGYSSGLQASTVPVLVLTGQRGRQPKSSFGVTGPHVIIPRAQPSAQTTIQASPQPQGSQAMATATAERKEAKAVTITGPRKAVRFVPPPMAQRAAAPALGQAIPAPPALASAAPTRIAHEALGALMDTRLANMELLTAARGASTKLAKLLEVSSAMLSILRAKKRAFTRDFAANIETALKLEDAWMDTPRTAGDVPPGIWKKLGKPESAAGKPEKATKVARAAKTKAGKAAVAKSATSGASAPDAPAESPTPPTATGAPISRVAREATAATQSLLGTLSAQASPPLPARKLKVTSAGAPSTRGGGGMAAPGAPSAASARVLSEFEGPVSAPGVRGSLSAIAEVLVRTISERAASGELSDIECYKLLGQILKV